VWSPQTFVKPYFETAHLVAASFSLARFISSIMLQLRKHWIYTVADFVDAREDRLLANGIDV
jgi:hypothetical protein